MSESKARLAAEVEALRVRNGELVALAVALNEEILRLRDCPEDTPWGATQVQCPSWFWYYVA